MKLFLYDIRLSIAAAVGCLVIASGSLSSAENPAPPCQNIAEFTRLAQSLPRTAERLAKNERLTVVAIGSSSTAGAGASSPAAAYPNQLAIALKQRFPAHDIVVLNRGVNGEEAQDMLNRFEGSVLHEHPDLVLWQVGTNSVLREHSISAAVAMVREGVARLRKAGADVVLIDPQFAPRVLAKPRHEDMVTLISTAAKEANINVFRRFAIMRHWREKQGIAFESFVSADGLHMNDWSYACVAKLLAVTIADAVTRAPTVAGTTAYYPAP
jgi:lysophospholipase L1-like esterase